MKRGDLIEVFFPGEPGGGWVAGVYLEAGTGPHLGYHQAACPDTDRDQRWETYSVQTDRIRPAGSVGEA